ncbi:MAG TPA: M48 family metalloprotease, partial [Terriglobales bacterium]|nr:M48 family metalloprotease [Terriglobales bacterium]
MAFVGTGPIDAVTFAESNPNSAPDTPEAREYNRIRRRLGIADALIGLAYLLLLLFAKTRGGLRWSELLRDWAYVSAGQHYALALFFFVGLMLLIGKLITYPLDRYSFELEHRYHLSNQKLTSWVWDEIKGWLLSLVLGTIVAELVYWTIRTDPEIWWLIAWAIFIFLTVIFAQLAPVVLFPIFYKFKPLENEELRERLVRLSERAGTRVRGVYEWKLSEKSNKANAALTGLGATRRIILADTLLQKYSADEIEAILAHELGHHVHRHVMKGIL